MSENQQQDSPLLTLAFWLFLIVFIYTAPSKMIFYYAGYEDANDWTKLTFVRDLTLSSIFWFAIYIPICKHSTALGIILGIIIAVLTVFMFLHPDPLAKKYLKEKHDRENPPQYEQADGTLGPKPDPKFHAGDAPSQPIKDDYWDQAIQNQPK